ncbi:STAS/SEC14 domain-containing protein [Primorskyibacter sp. S87]|uniref:STAS/SEC14 domain-containing protein n=1 Tax=Primorskyibacter sp. S87 TaxID=3415126 RepID=UPI003C7C8A3B
MITVETQSDGRVLEVEFSGQVTGADYENTLVPAIEKALSGTGHVRLLVIAGEEFKGYDLGAAWADTKLGLSHWSGFERAAVVSDISWLRTAVRLAAPMMPCPVQVFDLADAETARLWLRESLGAVHMLDLGGRGLQVRLMGQLDPEVIENAEADLDARIRERQADHGGFRLLLDLTEFDGWQGLSALASHFSLVRDHAGIPDRVAILGDKSWQHMAQRVAGRFLNAETRFFGGDELDQAKSWLAD